MNASPGTMDKTFQQVYQEVLNATDNPQHARTEATKYLRAKRMNIVYNPQMAGPEPKMTRSEGRAFIKEEVDKLLMGFVGVSPGDGKRIVEEMVRERIKAALDKEILRGAIQNQIEAILRDMLKKHIKGPDTQAILTKIQEEVEAAAIKAAEELVRGLSFRPKFNDNAPARKIVK